MDESLKRQPYKGLGSELKALRRKFQESIVEVSGAVEIDGDVLERIEAGHERPSEDVLMMLISHFNVDNNEAVELWELAGYDQIKNIDGNYKNEDELPSKASVVMIMALDSRILYSDGASIKANKNGLVFSFLQNSVANQQVPISRIGMSYEQANEFLQVLTKTLNQIKILRQPKALMASNRQKNRKTNKNKS